MNNFVGRKHECNYFNSILSDFLEEYASEYVKENPVRSQSVLDVYGVGGIGKTSLLKQMLILTQEKAVEKDYLFSMYIDTSGYDNFVEVLYRIRSKIKDQYDDILICQTDFFEFDSVYTLFYGQDAGSNRKVEVGVFYFNYSGIPCEKIAIILLSAY